MSFSGRPASRRNHHHHQRIHNNSTGPTYAYHSESLPYRNPKTYSTAVLFLMVADDGYGLGVHLSLFIKLAWVNVEWNGKQYILSHYVALACLVRQRCTYWQTHFIYGR